MALVRIRALEMESLWQFTRCWVMPIQSYLRTVNPGSQVLLRPAQSPLTLQVPSLDVNLKQTEFDLITVKDRPAWDAVCHMEGPNLPHIILMASCQAPGKPLEPC